MSAAETTSTGARLLAELDAAEAAEAAARAEWKRAERVLDQAIVEHQRAQAAYGAWARGRLT